MFVGCLHGDEIIVLQDGRLDHPPVVTYFTRYDTRDIYEIYSPRFVDFSGTTRSFAFRHVFNSIFCP